MLSDVIAAVATPSGTSATALIRVSGNGAHDVAREVLSPFEVHPLRTARLASVMHPVRRETLDEVLYLVYGAPRSYTGEDVVEISSHGGLLVPAEVLSALLAAGARLALPGEFTRRAVANAKIDLLQAEGVGDLIAATAPAQRRAALRQLDHGLSARIGALRDQVLELEALVCYEIDFPEEDSGPVPEERIASAIADMQQALARLLETATEGERLREGALCVIAGRPNAGKSSLFNALLGSDRAIVTDIPGTTRDAIEAPATCEGLPFRLIDTAGLCTSSDKVEQIGIEVSQRYLGAADVVLFCQEDGRETSVEEVAFRARVTAPTLLVLTKTDLVKGERKSCGTEEGVVRVSAHSGEGLLDLRKQLAQVAFSKLESFGEVELLVTRERHRLSLERALEEIRAFDAARSAGFEGAVSATHLRAAVTALEDIIGIVTSEDVLDRVFSTFCIGK